MEGAEPGGITVFGGGGWGTALAVHLSGRGQKVALWVREPDVAEEMSRDRVNGRFLPGVHLPDGIRVINDLAEAAGLGSRMVVIAVPTHGIRGVLEKIGRKRRDDLVAVSVAKGFEVETLKRPSEVVSEVLGLDPGSVCVLSGPSHAEEVGRTVPTAIVAASTNPKTAIRVQEAFFSPRFRVYTHTDTLGVELGGALKNVIAVACGIGDGLGFGDNTRAVLMTRGLAEMTRLGMAMGAKRETFQGLAGLGDLIVTCGSELSRNRALGKRIGRGEKLSDILAGMTQVAEGVRASQAAVKLATSRKVSMPISQQVYAVLFEGRPVLEALDGLLSRGMRPEEDGEAR